jgi:hypothetical protein
LATAIEVDWQVLLAGIAAATDEARPRSPMCPERTHGDGGQGGN